MMLEGIFLLSWSELNCDHIRDHRECLNMEDSSQHKKQRLDDSGNCFKSLEIATKLIESGDSVNLREMLANGELSEVNMYNGTGKKLLVTASEAGYLSCLRVLLDHLEASATESVNTKSADYQGCGTAYISCGKHRFIKISTPTKPKDDSDEMFSESLVLVAFHRRYHHRPQRYYKGYEVAVIEPGAIMSKYIYVDIANLFIEACKEGNFRLVEYLISMGADVNRVDYHGRNAAVLACESGDVKLMKLLLKHRADVNTRFHPIRRDRIYDADHENDEVSHYNSCDVKEDDDEWWYLYISMSYRPNVLSSDTLLHIACPSDPPMMKLLLDHGADYNATDRSGRTPFMKAYNNNSSLNKHAIDILLTYVFNRSADGIEVCDQYPLILACNEGNIPLIERMLRHGTDANATDGRGDSALLCLFRGVSYFTTTKSGVLMRYV